MEDLANMALALARAMLSLPYILVVIFFFFLFGRVSGQRGNML